MALPKTDYKFLHGQHNEEVCDLLLLQKKYPDWVITTAFYAALHFVSYKIFPFNHKVPPDTTYKIESIEQWQAFKNYTSNKRHELLNDLVAKYIQHAAPEYEWLLSTSMTARYHNYQFDQLIAEKAARLMKQIKKICQPVK